MVSGRAEPVFFSRSENLPFFRQVSLKLPDPFFPPNKHVLNRERRRSGFFSFSYSGVRQRSFRQLDNRAFSPLFFFFSVKPGLAFRTPQRAEGVHCSRSSLFGTRVLPINKLVGDAGPCDVIPFSFFFSPLAQARLERRIASFCECQKNKAVYLPLFSFFFFFPVQDEMAGHVRSEIFFSGEVFRAADHRRDFLRVGLFLFPPAGRMGSFWLAGFFFCLSTGRGALFGGGRAAVLFPFFPSADRTPDTRALPPRANVYGP